MPEVNYLAVLLAALSAFLLGGLWYSPLLFANKWAALVALGEDKLKSGSMAMIFGGAFVLNLIASWMFAVFLAGVGDVRMTAAYGFAAGLCWVATSFGVSYLFERRPFALWAINAGYFTLQFTLIGAILGAMG